MKFNKIFLGGLLAGVLGTLALTLIVRASGPGQKKDVLAEVGGEALTKEALRVLTAPDLIPVENDEYQILSRGVDEWVQTELLEREAKAQGMTLEELYKKEIWSHVRVSYADISEYYNKHRELFTESFEKASPLIAQELRRAGYARRKEAYLAGLGEKYKAKIYLKKPASFIESLALPVPSVGEKAGEEAAPGVPPSRGPAGAPVTLAEFADFHCHFCKKATPTLEKLLENYPGKIRWVFRHFPLSSTPGEGSFLTHEASVCAQEQGKFWEFHDAVFARPASPGPSDLYAIAEEIGLSRDRFEECLKSGRHREFLNQESKEGAGRGVSGTPTVFVNDRTLAGAYPYEDFKAVVESILNPGATPPAQEKAPSPKPEAVSTRVKFDDLGGRPSLGPREAPVTLVEFSDFHCPFCKKVTPTLEKIMKDYPKKIRRVWRHYPLSMHAGADRTHAASECAHDQGKFWEYHDQLFENQGASFDDPFLADLAGKAGLNKKKFEKCLTGGKHSDLIRKEIQSGDRAGVRGTPATFVNGRLFSGAQPYESFKQAVEAELASS